MAVMPEAAVCPSCGETLSTDDLKRGDCPRCGALVEPGDLIQSDG